MGERPIGRVADRLASRGGNVGRRCGFAVQVACGRRVVGGPGVPHGDRGVKQIPRMDRRMGEVHTDGREVLFVPDPGDGLRLEIARRKGKQRDRDRGRGCDRDGVFL